MVLAAACVCVSSNGSAYSVQHELLPVNVKRLWRTLSTLLCNLTSPRCSKAEWTRSEYIVLVICSFHHICRSPIIICCADTMQAGYIGLRSVRRTGGLPVWKISNLTQKNLIMCLWWERVIISLHYSAKISRQFLCSRQRGPVVRTSVFGRQTFLDLCLIRYMVDRWPLCV